MKKEEVKTLIRLGFEPAHYFKRSVWVKVERVMDYLTNKGEVKKVTGIVKYSSPDHTEKDIERWADMYMRSPFSQHLEELKQLSKETRLPLNSIELLNAFLKVK